MKKTTYDQISSTGWRGAASLILSDERTNNSKNPKKLKSRDEIQEDTKAFLESGGKITKIKSGISGVDFMAKQDTKEKKKEFRDRSFNSYTALREEKEMAKKANRAKRTG